MKKKITQRFSHWVFQSCNALCAANFQTASWKDTS